jgi:hypothetical protein
VLPRLSYQKLWFPLIKKIISSQFKKGDRLIVTIDRTQWKANNISIVSVIWKKELYQFTGYFCQRKLAVTFMSK